MKRHAQNFHRVAAGRVSFAAFSAAFSAGILASILASAASACAGAIASVDYALVRQALYPSKSAAQLDAMIGVTPMIGVNDTGGETFTLADAQLHESSATSHGSGLLSFWSAARDVECAGGTQTYASDDCSGILQSQFQYSGIFNQLNP